ncbi:helix-hairpin-helix domain-containing protein [Mesoplasma lactucae]|nr:helix-hairpin-helix domain-containing protein [Mesoplasma lactucae]ATZ20137.1 Holliday junction DNA helicase RuvA [Mesoplasma lactucae ATCC 49193]MCL8216885.1 Holliday junction ATP-dependent DNA helicase RuvA [Mesoplasma lactucae ATCC 49193]
MLDSLILKTTNHYLKERSLFFLLNDQVYKYELLEYKEMLKTDKFFLYFYQDEYKTYSYGFYDEKIRDLFKTLLTINSIGLKHAKTILETFSYEEIILMVKEFDYEKLTAIKGFGVISAKTIIESLHKTLFDVSYTSKEEKMILAVTKLGYPCQLVLKTIKTVDSKLSDDKFLKVLLERLGEQKQVHG